MNWIIVRIRGSMLTAGVLTSTMLYAAVAPVPHCDLHSGKT